MLLSNMFSAQVVSNENENLTITAEKKISVEGHEGVFFDGKMLMFDVERDVKLSSSLVGKIDELSMRAHLNEIKSSSNARTLVSPRFLN